MTQPDNRVRRLPEGADGAAVLAVNSLRDYVRRFNGNDGAGDGQAIRNACAADWMACNIPLFECPDKDIEKVYYFRWWTFRKHLKQTPDGYVVTEFLPQVGWSGKHNTISCAAGHHYYEGRWLHDARYLDDYSRFWFRQGGEPRRYSCWIADALYARTCVTGDRGLAVDLLPDLMANYGEWEKTHMGPDGLYWQKDDRDGMECSISGALSPDHTGYRVTINSYMYGDAMAIAAIAEWAGEPGVAGTYRHKAASIRERVLQKLWDADACFFKVLPRGPHAALADVRELHGFTPWYFELPPGGEGYEEAWVQLMDPGGFYAPFGPATAEQRHPAYAISYEGHDCKWNGPSWPFSTSVTLTALANLLNNDPRQTLSKEDYLRILKNYTASHRLRREDESIVPWIDESLHPYTGDWITRSCLKQAASRKGVASRGSVERGKDYNHSTYGDLIITGLVGLRPRADNILEIHPLVPDHTWAYFCLDRVRYHGYIVTIVWDRSGETYGVGRGLTVWVDGAEIAASESLTPLRVALPACSAPQIRK